MKDFFAMGGYALYVWASYGVTLVVIAVEIARLRSRAAPENARRMRSAHHGGAR